MADPSNWLNAYYDWNQFSGLLYSFPLGQVAGDGRDPVPDGRLETVMKRDHLVCGVRATVGSEIAAFDMEFCQGLAASIFKGSRDKVVFVELQDMAGSYASLAGGEVDVVAGARLSLQASYRELQTGQGFVFSTPYYYDLDNKDAYAFMTNRKDGQWNDYVNWIVMAIILAEEEGITSENSKDIPVVELFGQGLKQMFRDCVSAVGNYAEVYHSALQGSIPRAGANFLNDGSGPQLFPVPLI